MIDKDHAEIVIAALLHDLGKVTQRAGAEECLTPGMDGQLLPLSKDKRYTHKHAWYTHGAILLIKDSLPPSCNVERIARLAAAHHNPGSWEEWIIAEADRISSGADRTDRELDAELKGTYIEQPNLSIFSAVKLGKPATSPSMFHKLGPQTVPGSIPVEFFKNDRNGYKAIWEGLRGDFAKIKVADIEDWLAVADSILEHWTWAVPSTTIDQPDISLYDHLRTTTAFASALYQFHLSNGSRDDLRQMQLSIKVRYN